MNSLGNNQYDTFKDRRYAALFWSTLMMLIGLLLLAFVVYTPIHGSGLEPYFIGALPGIGLLLLAWGFLRFRRAQLDRKKRLTRPPLSRDELRVARSKLRNGMRPIKHPAPRVPDTNLKY